MLKLFDLLDPDGISFKLKLLLVKYFLKIDLLLDNLRYLTGQITCFSNGKKTIYTKRVRSGLL